MQNARPQLPQHAFDKIDPSNDALFYAEQRLVTDIDDCAVTGLTKFYEDLVLRADAVLDIMSSRVSDLPSSFRGDVNANH
jgi:hypothetical protein